MACLALALAAALPASRLRPQTDLAALLPEDSPAAQDYRTFLDSFGGLEKVFVILWAEGEVEPVEDGGASPLVEAAWRLEETLAQSPLVAGVRAGVRDEDEAFVLDWVVPRMALLRPDGVEELTRRATPAGLREAASRLHATAQLPGAELQRELASRDPLGLASGLLERAGGGAELPVDPISGAFLDREGEASLLIVQPLASEIDAEGGRALRALIAESWAPVAADRAFGGIQMAATGGPLYAAADEELIRRDLIRTVGTSLAGCLVVLLLSFGGWTTAAATAAALGVAALWLGGALRLVAVEISGLSLGFAAVLIGLGIDYAIHGATRYREARERGEDPAVALESAFHHSGAAIVASAATTAGAFSVLFLAHFRPLFEIGVVVALGILAVAVATATVGGACLVLVDRRRPQALGGGGPLWQALGRGSSALVEVSARRAPLALAAGGVVSVLALLGLGRLSLDADPRALRPEGHPAIAAEQRLVEEFGLGTATATLVVPGRDLDEALERAAAVGALLRERLGPDLDLASPADWLVSSRLAERRLAELGALGRGGVAAELERALRAENLSPYFFAPGIEALARLTRGADPGAPPRSVWPDWLEEQVAPIDGGVALALRVRLSAAAGRAAVAAEPLSDPALLGELSAAAPGVAVASSARLGAEIRRLALLDAERLFELALLAIVGMVALSFRGRLRLAGASMLPVLAGTLWTFGLWGWVVGRSDLMSLAVAPILLGIGIDDGLHAGHAAALAGSFREGVATCGRAIALTTLTTVVGFGSLATSSIPALRSAGALLAGGVGLCLLATLVLLPAVGALGAGRSR
ncbi:MAG TPA: MMPL family transporter [Thermoanaerobaculia bacterium]|nr:MMPL family transporter [Thermoanaerobaculia bacterium]